ncbi:MAG: choice-of-anchor V domain-containing protein [Chitinophagales bacterium]|nr:choice-of-anchor V domain-containing protein [Chitinophagales bacterium]
MKRNLLIAFAITSAGIMASLPFQATHSNSAQAPAGHTGAPGEPTCNTSGCHTGSALSTNDPTISLSGVSPSLTNGYTPGTLYNLSVNAGSGGRYGFQLTALDENGNKVGTFALGAGSNADHEAISTASGREYIGHKDATTQNSWIFKWTAPATATDVYFYLTVNTANNNSAVSGDQIRQKVYRLTTSSFAAFTYTPTGVPEASDAGIEVFPNPVTDAINLSLNANGEQVVADVYSLNGQLVKTLVNEPMNGQTTKSFPVKGELQSGLYLIKLSVGEQTYFKKILVQ